MTAQTESPAAVAADPLSLCDVGVAGERILAAIEALTAEFRQLRADLAARTSNSATNDVHLVGLIAERTNGLEFNAGELVDHCRLAADLRAQLTAACGGALEPRRVGLLLRQLQGAGVRRIGEDRDGAIWQCGSARVTRCSQGRKWHDG